MALIWITALAVGASTVIGSVLSFWIKNVPKEIENMLTSFAAGIMLAATFISLLMPAIETSNSFKNTLMVVGGMLTGSIAIAFADRFVPHIHRYMKIENTSAELDGVLLFVIAIAIHNFPEGMAVGVSFGDKISNAIGLGLGISLQNIPEGLVTILPLILAGVPRSKAFLLALITGLIEAVGVLVGYFAVGFSTRFLPFVLAFAAGTMLFVISHDMIPSTHALDHEDKRPTYALILGVIMMLLIDYLGIFID